MAVDMSFIFALSSCAVCVRTTALTASRHQARTGPLYVIRPERAPTTCMHAWSVGHVETAGRQRALGLGDEALSELRVRTLEIP